MLDRIRELLAGKKLAALDIGTSSIKLAEIDAGSRGPILRKFSLLPLASGLVSAGEINDVHGVGQNLQSLTKIAKTARKNVVVSFGGGSVVVKKISMPVMDESLIGEQIKWEAEQYLPFDVAESSLEHHVLKGRSNTESMEVLLVAIRQETLFRALEATEFAGLKMTLADVSGFALANCFEANYGITNEPVALLNMGGAVTTFVVVDKGEVIFCRDLPVGGDYHTSEISRAMGISLGEAEALKVSASLGQEAPEDVLGLIQSANDQIVDEVRNGFEFFNANASGNGTIRRFYVTGGSQFLPGLVESVAKAVAVPSEILNPFQRVSFDSKSLSPSQISQISAVGAVAIGLGLRKRGDR